MELELDPFLNHDDFVQIQSHVRSLLDECTALPKEKRIKRIKQLFKFEKVFSYDSAQGMAGIVHVTLPNGKDAKLVFKLSIEINRGIEHEFTALRALNSVRSYCPNFVATPGLLPGYINRTFYESDEVDMRREKLNVFDVKSTSIPINYLLQEYVSDIDFKHVIKYGDKTLVTGTILGLLCALQMAQDKCKFVHYDLHTGNILMRKVEDNSYFAYVIKDEVVLYPTCGWFPVCIDMGSSYVSDVDKFNTRAYVGNYVWGQQPTVFDQYADCHHFLLHALSYLEKGDNKNDRHFRYMALRCMHMFRHFKVWRYKGWKHFPANLYYLYNDAVAASGAVVCQFYRKVKVNIIECVALATKLPWKPYEDTELEAMLAYYYPQVVEMDKQGSIKWKSTCNTPLLKLLKCAVEDICHFIRILDDDPLVKQELSPFMQFVHLWKQQ